MYLGLANVYQGYFGMNFQTFSGIEHSDSYVSLSVIFLGLSYTDT